MIARKEKKKYAVEFGVLRISTRIHPDKGGPAKQVYLLSKYISNKNIKTINLSCNPYKRFFINKEKINQNNYNFYLPFSAPGLSKNIFKLIIFTLVFFIIGILKSIYIIKKYKIKVIHAHTPPPSGFLAWFLSKMFNIPFFYTIHGLDYQEFNLLNLDVNLVMRKSKINFVVSKEIMNFLYENFRLNNTRVFPNSIDQKEYFHVKSIKEKLIIINKLKLSDILSDKDYIISYIGYMFFFQKVKGMVDFLDAFSNFLNGVKDLDSRSKIKLLYIGDGKYSYLILKKIEELNLLKNVHFLGKRNDINLILSISDLLALTSYREGFPNVILEAMASSVPCLGTNVGEISNIIDETGFIVEPNDINGIYKSLVCYYNMSHEKKKELMNLTRNRITNHYDIKLIGNKIYNIYKSVIDK